MKVLAPECMLPTKLKCHLETSHPNMVIKSRDYFTRRLKELKEQKSTFVKQASVLHSALLASYKVAYRVSKCKNPPQNHRRINFTGCSRCGEHYGW